MKKFLKISGQKVHLRQGELDGACTVYSLMMGLIANGLISKEEICDLDRKVDGRKGLGRLIREFFNKVPKSEEEPESILLRSGYLLMDIQNKLSHAYSSYVTSWYASSGCDEEHKRKLMTEGGYMPKEELIDFIVDELDKNWPVEIGFRYRGGGGHAVLAVGYERIGGQINSLYCLDPGDEAPRVKNKKYNAEIKLDHNGKRIQHHVEMDRDILIDEVLSLELRKRQ